MSPSAVALPIALLAALMAALVATAFALVAIAVVSAAIARAARGRRIDSLADLRDRARDAIGAGGRVLIVVPGCPPRARNGRPSAYLAGRARAAAAAFHHLGGVSLLCSGRVRATAGGATADRDEAEALAALLEASAVPRAAIELDRDARRTIDTIEHVARHHGDVRIVFVTQPFHLARTLFLARARGLDAWGLAAPGPDPGSRNRLREGLGGLRAVIDIGIAGLRERLRPGR
jgi:SanA protein